MQLSIRTVRPRILALSAALTQLGSTLMGTDIRRGGNPALTTPAPIQRKGGTATTLTRTCFRGMGVEEARRDCRVRRGALLDPTYRPIPTIATVEPWNIWNKRTRNNQNSGNLPESCSLYVASLLHRDGQTVVYVVVRDSSTWLSGCLSWPTGAVAGKG